MKWRLGRPLGLLLAGVVACSDDSERSQPKPPDPHAEHKDRLREFETSRRAETDFERRPASDHRFGADPVDVIALPTGEFAGLLRGRDRLVVLDADGLALAEIETPHLPTGLALAPGGRELAVVGIGEAELRTYSIAPGEAGAIELTETHRVALGSAAMSPRDLAFSVDRLWIVDEGTAVIHTLAWPIVEEPVVSHPHCRGAIEVRIVGDLLVSNCLIDHALRIDGLAGAAAPLPLAQRVHDGPIWAFDAVAGSPGGLSLALAGVENRPLDRRDGGFGWVDSFAWLLRFDRASAAILPIAEINLSELGLVTPKSIRLQPADGSWNLDLTGYASAERLRIHGSGGTVDEVARAPWLPGSQSLIQSGTTWIAADPLFDAWLIGQADQAPKRVAIADPTDDRNFDERLGEALVYTTAMAPENSAEGQRSRFTCETCHFEGRGDGRTHWTGREDVHATSKTLFGLFENRPHFSRALDKTMAIMVDNEFKVANKHSPRDPWAALSERELPWLTELDGWPGEVDGERLRAALMAFLIRWSLPSNPLAWARAGQPFTELEAGGAELFRDRCESCHRARLVADDPSTQIEFDRWATLVLSTNGPIVWASDERHATGIKPWVHKQGTRVPSLRRLALDGPYFTNGSAKSVEEVLLAVRVAADGSVDHQLVDAGGVGLEAGERGALAAFLRLL